MIAQAAAPGELISLEGFVHRGRVTVIGVTGRRKIASTESAFLFPYDHRLSPHARRLCEEAIEALVTRSKFKNGFFHAEFMVEGRNALLIDCNVGRPGGANIVEILSEAFDTDPVDFYKNFIAIQLGKQPTIPLSRWKNPPKKTLGIAYGLSASSRVLQIDGLGRFRSRHTLAVNFGAKVDRMGSSNWAWVGLLAGEPSQVISELRTIRICTQGGWQSPCYATG
jgi:hypothetical protein